MENTSTFAKYPPERAENYTKVEAYSLEAML